MGLRLITVDAKSLAAQADGKLYNGWIRLSHSKATDLCQCHHSKDNRQQGPAKEPEKGHNFISTYSRQKKKIIEFPPSFESAYLQEMPNQRNPFTKYIKDAKSKCGKSDRKNIPLSSTNN